MLRRPGNRIKKQYFLLGLINNKQDMVMRGRGAIFDIATCVTETSERGCEGVREGVGIGDALHLRIVINRYK